MDQDDVAKRKAALWPVVLIMFSIGAERIGARPVAMILLLVAILVAFASVATSNPATDRHRKSGHHG
jgi:hypothetical protein